MLGYTGFADGYVSIDVPDDMPFWLTNVTCTGREGNLRECNHSQWGKIEGCQGNKAAGILCYKNGMIFITKHCDV